MVVGDHDGNCGNVNVKITMNVGPLALMMQMMDQRINSAVYVVVLSEPVNFPLSVRHSNEMGDRMKQRKNIRPRRVSNTRPSDLITSALVLSNEKSNRKQATSMFKAIDDMTDTTPVYLK